MGKELDDELEVVDDAVDDDACRTFLSLRAAAAAAAVGAFSLSDTRLQFLRLTLPRDDAAADNDDGLRLLFHSSSSLSSLL
jgi:hypothetical protein